MPIRIWALMPLVLTVVVATPRAATAQGGILDRARQAAQQAADAAKKAATDVANREINSAVQDAAAQDVADGSFVAVFSPWSSSDGANRVEVARYTGAAFVVTTGASRQIVLCDNQGAQSWMASFTIRDAAGGSAATAGGASPARGGSGSAPGRGSSGGRSGAAGGAPSRGGASSAADPSTQSGGGGRSGRGGAAGSAPGGGAAGGGGGRGGGSSRGAGSGTADSSADSSSRSGGRRGSGAAAGPSAGGREYRFPSTAVTITLPTTGAKAGTPSQGSISIGDVSETIVAGGGKVRFAKATIPGDTKPDIVDLGVTFKATVLAAGATPVGCQAPTAAKGSTGGRGASGRGTTAAPATPPGAAARTIAPPATPAAASGGNVPVFAEGDMVMPKIDNVKLLATADDSARVVGVLRMTDELVYLGDEQNGYLHVQGSVGEGWVRTALLRKR